MRILFFVFCALSHPVFADDWNFYEGDVTLNSDDFDQIFVGNSLVFYDGGKSGFGPDGAYSYTYDGGGTARGVFSVKDAGMICVDFDNGWSRCDTFVSNNGRLVLLTEKGERYPIKEVTKGTGS